MNDLDGILGFIGENNVTFFGDLNIIIFKSGLFSPCLRINYYYFLKDKEL